MKHGHWRKLQLAAQAAWDRHTVFALQQRMHDAATFTQEETLSTARLEPAAPDTTPSQLLLLGQTQVLLGSTQHMISIIMQFLNGAWRRRPYYTVLLTVDACRAGQPPTWLHQHASGTSCYALGPPCSHPAAQGMRTHLCADFLKAKDYEYVRQLELYVACYAEVFNGCWVMAVDVTWLMT